MNIAHIPWNGDAREYLMNFCTASRDSKLREMENIACISPSSEALDESLDCLQAEADKWHTCLKWLDDRFKQSRLFARCTGPLVADDSPGRMVVSGPGESTVRQTRNE